MVRVSVRLLMIPRSQEHTGTSFCTKWRYSDCVMTFRAPKTGIVSFKVKRGITKPAPNSTVGDEPYLRQNGNTSGTVTLSLLVKDQHKQLVTLRISFVSTADWNDFNNIEGQGNYIRVVAKLTNATKPSLHITPVITYQDAVIEDIIPPSSQTDVSWTNELSVPVLRLELKIWKLRQCADAGCR